MIDMIGKLTDDTYGFWLKAEGTDILKVPKISVVKVSAPWCGPCQLLKNHYEKWAENHKAEYDVKFWELDNDSNKKFIEEYKVDTLPTIIFFVYGIETFSIKGMTRANIFDSVLEKVREIKTEIN